MIVCELHRYVDPLCPCPWPGCPNGTEDRWFVAPGKKGRVEAVRLCVRDETLHAWVLEGRTVAFCLPKLSQYGSLLDFNVGAVDLIWHYTARESAASIVRSGELWVSHHTSLNDMSELAHGRDVAAAACTGPSVPAGLRDAFMRSLDGDLDAFVCSFSIVANDLPQWREYGESCRGVALGFDPLGFLELIGRDPMALNLSLVSYDRAQQARAFEYIVALASHVWELDQHRGTVEMPMFIKMLNLSLSQVIPLCKNPAFQSERECRLAVVPRLALFGVANKLPRRTRDAGAGPIPYLTTRDIDASFKLPLRGVLIGPQATEEDAIAIRRALDESGWDVPIERSRIPLRQDRC